MNSLEIKKFREKYNLSQKELADLAAVSVRTVRSWEYGERNISKSAQKTIENHTHSEKENNTFYHKIPADIQSKKKDNSFDELPIEQKLNILYIRSIELDDKLHKIMDYFDEYLSPLFEYMKKNTKDNGWIADIPKKKTNSKKESN